MQASLVPLNRPPAFGVGAALDPVLGGITRVGLLSENRLLLSMLGASLELPAAFSLVLGRFAEGASLGVADLAFDN